MNYLIIATVLFFLVLNIYFRIKIIGRYKALNNKKINIDPKLMFDKSALQAYIEAHHPEHAQEIDDFRRALNNLLIIAVAGLVSILFLFLWIKFV